MKSYYLGLDLGQSMDYTALAVLEGDERPAAGQPEPPAADGATPEAAPARPAEPEPRRASWRDRLAWRIRRDHRAAQAQQALLGSAAPDDSEQPAPPPAPRKVRHYALRALKRWPLGTSYPQIVEDVTRIVGQPPLLQVLETDVVGKTETKRALLAIDATGVGRPVVDELRRAKPAARLFPVTITAGQGESVSGMMFNVAKVVLISCVQVLIQQRRLQFSPKLPEAETILREFQSYRVKVTAAANEVFDPREGQHDDIVLAVTLACWLGERQRDFRAW